MEEIEEKKFRHPEQKDDEIWLMNIHESELGKLYLHIGWKSKRLSSLGYTCNGEVMKYSRSVFIKISEVIDGILELDPKIEESTKNTWRKMLKDNDVDAEEWVEKKERIK